MTDSPSARCSAAELRDIGLFAALAEPALSHLAERLQVSDAAPGEFAFREGEAGHHFFILLAGEMEVLKRSHIGVEARVALLGPGDWFGEMSVVDVAARSASVRALAPSRLLRVSASDLDSLYRTDLKSYTLIVLNIARQLSRRLRVADGLLADFVANVVGRHRPPAG